MYRIGEFSQLGQISVRMLRHYDKLDLLKPSLVDDTTGYRYYLAEQLPSLHKIIALNGLGIPLAEIQAIIGSNAFDLTELRVLLQERKTALRKEISQQRLMLANIESRLKLLESETAINYEIVTRPAPPTRLFAVRSIVPDLLAIPEYCRKMYAALYKQLTACNIRPHGVEMTLYRNREFVENDIDMMAGTMISHPAECPESLDDVQLPAEQHVAALIYRGPYSGLPEPILFLLKWLAMNHYHPLPPLRELHLSGKAHTAEGTAHQDAVIELQLPFVLSSSPPDSPGYPR